MASARICLTWITTAVLVWIAKPGVCFERRILLFGGNGFLGASTAEKFIEAGDNVTIVNRGNWYWDSRDRINPHVDVIHCDREQDLGENCPELTAYMEQDLTLDAVVDFSAYRAKHIEDVVPILSGKAKLYVQISTDSVYDVCDKKHGGPSKETDAVRPEDEDERKLRISHFSYGHRKLAAEEALQKQRLEGGFPFVALRLPDVVGPRDTTYRWWVYQLWVKLSNRIPTRAAKIPIFLQGYNMSFVYVDDVAAAILDVLGKGAEIYDQAINLAYREPFTKEELFTDLQEELGVKFPLEVEENRTLARYMYPSVRRGPLDIKKAESLLSWEPTPWKQVVKETVAFYEAAMRDDSEFQVQRDEVIQIAGADLYADNPGEFYDALEEEYKIKLHHFKHPRDEL